MKRKLALLLFVVISVLCVPFIVQANPDVWVSPTGFENPDDTWYNEELAYDENENTYAAVAASEPTGWNGRLILTIAPMETNKLRFMAVYFAVCNHQIDIKVYKDDAWVDVYQGVYPHQTWVEKSFAEGNVTKVQIKIYSDVYGTGTFRGFYELDLYEPPSQYVYGTFLMLITFLFAPIIAVFLIIWRKI